MSPSVSANPAKRNPPAAKAAPTPTEKPSSGVADPAAAAPPTTLDEDGGYTFVYKIDVREAKRLLTRTGRGTREEMEKELPRYVERIVKRAIDSEVY